MALANDRSIHDVSRVFGFVDIAKVLCSIALSSKICSKDPPLQGRCNYSEKGCLLDRLDLVDRAECKA